MRVLSIAAPLVSGLMLSGVLLAAAPASAQTPPSGSGCTAAPAAPATPETKSAASGTAPGNSGSTGFSGAGLGGAYTGTTPNGATPASPSIQPATARGLDPISAPPKAASTGRC